MFEKNIRPACEIIVGSSDPATARVLMRLKREGRVKRLAARLYTTNMTDSPERIVRRNLWTIVGKLWPGARLSHRTAMLFSVAHCHKSLPLPLSLFKPRRGRFSLSRRRQMKPAERS